MTVTKLPAELTKIGFTRVEDFQLAWNLGPRLKVDDVFGPKTEDALEVSYTAFTKGDPDLSAHFSAAECMCHCRGTLAGCHRVRAFRDLLSGLEAYRRATDGALPLYDVYRCPKHNEQIGGAHDSMHLIGAAADPKVRLSLKNARAIGVFSGIGHQTGAPQRVTHVDVRHLANRAGVHNTTGGTCSHPTLFIDEG